MAYVFKKKSELSRRFATVKATVHTDEGEIFNIIYTKTHLDAEQDIIFGLSWFQEYSPG